MTVQQLVDKQGVGCTLGGGKEWMGHKTASVEVVVVVGLYTTVVGG